MSRHADIDAALAALEADYSAKIIAQRQREEENRDTAFHAEAVLVAGIPCRPLCLRDVRSLTKAGCVFLAGGDRLDLWESAKVFLWQQYLQRRDHWYFAGRFKNRLERMALLLGQRAMVRAVHEYIEGVFQDRPAYKNRPENLGHAESNWSYEAALIDQLGARYAWATPDYVLSAPLAQLRQYLNLIHAENCAQRGERAVFQGLPSKALMDEYVKKMNELRAQAQPTATATATV